LAKARRLPALRLRLFCPRRRASGRDRGPRGPFDPAGFRPPSIPPRAAIQGGRSV